MLGFSASPVVVGRMAERSSVGGLVRGLPACIFLHVLGSFEGGRGYGMVSRAGSGISLDEQGTCR